MIIYKILFLTKFALFFISINSNAMIIDQTFDDKKLEYISIEIFKNVKCTSCQGQSILDSESSTAKDMRNFIRMELKAGKTKKQIEKYLIDRFGIDILLTPPLDIYTYLLWFFPLLAIIWTTFSIRKKYQF